MDLQQFGATVKQKYPQYNNYSDEEIGQKMLDKYPQYKSKVTMPSSGPLTTISNVLRGVGLGAIPDAAAAVTNIPNDIKNFNNPQAFKIGLEQNPLSQAGLQRAVLHEKPE